MALREGDAGTALQITFESHGAFLIGELDYQIDFPRPDAVWRHRPALCAASLDATSAAKPV
jgi:hypothetical protein